MKKWYRTTAVKLLLIASATIAAIVGGISLIMLLGFQSSFSGGLTESMAVNEFEDSTTFDELMVDAAVSVTEKIRLETDFETDGKYNGDKLVDIVDFAENRRITGNNDSGLAYTLENLQRWGRDVDRRGVEYDAKNTIVVCRKTDQSYYYYYLSQMKSLFREGKLRLVVNDSELIPGGEGEKEFFYALDEGYELSDYYGNGSGEIIKIMDAEGTLLYTDCWTFPGGFEEEAAPAGYKNLVEAINDLPELNGRLDDVFNYLEAAVNTIYNEINIYKDGDASWTEGNTNLTYLYADMSGKKLYTNNSAYKDIDKLDEYIAAIQKRENSRYVVVKPKLADFESNLKNISAGLWKESLESNPQVGKNYVFAAAVDTTYPIQDVFYHAKDSYNAYMPYLRYAGWIVVICVLWVILSVVWLTIAAGRSGSDEVLHLNTFDRWKTELGAAAAIAPWVFVTLFLGMNWNGVGLSVGYTGTAADPATHYATRYYIFSMSTVDELVLAGYIGITMLLFFAGYLSLVRRIKGKTLWKNSILRIVIHFFKEFWSSRSVTLRAVFVFGCFVLLHWLAFAASGNAFAVMLMFAAEAAAAYYIVKNAIAKDKIRKGVERISSGEVDYQIPLKGLRGENLRMSERINDIGNGLQRAVETEVKSERLKTDLITNVSHDIKTPLTSIINYVDLLKRENIDDPKIQGYLDILEAKSQRLKVLTEDVVEASKVSSGNIKLEFMDVNLVEMLNQTVGEFSEKMQAQDLQVIVNLPEEPAVIRADGRRLWRVLENIFNNTAKYAMPGTRVYADLYTEGDKVKFSLKNVSAQQLNIKAEELTERFIRGDISRSTEGSGLGLSIARTLTEMQGGTFELYLDGDLFKVMISFPKSKE